MEAESKERETSGTHVAPVESYLSGLKQGGTRAWKIMWRNSKLGGEHAVNGNFGGHALRSQVPAPLGRHSALLKAWEKRG